MIIVSRGGDLPGVADVTLFQLTVSPDGRPGGPDQLTFDNRGMLVTGAALSPDDMMLALSLMHEFPPGSLYGSVEVVNLASGKPAPGPATVPRCARSAGCGSDWAVCSFFEGLFDLLSRCQMPSSAKTASARWHRLRFG